MIPGSPDVSPLELHWVQRAGRRIEQVYRAQTYEEAAELLAADPARRIVAGASDLLLELEREGQGGTVSLIDVSAVDDAQRVEVADGGDLRLSAGVTHALAIESEVVRRDAFPLAQACLEIGSPQLRNRATIAGNVVTASPANDSISALMALGARVATVRFEDGSAVRHEHELDNFYPSFRATVLDPLDVVESIVIPAPPVGQRGIWVKAGLRKAQAISVVHAGLVLSFDDANSVTGARIALGSVGPTVALCDAAAQALIGSELTPAVIAEAAEAAVESVTPIDDGRATAAYRSDTVATVVSRALTALADGRERDRWPVRVPRLAPTAATSLPPLRHIEAATEISVTVNGRATSGPIPGAATLLDWVREHVGTGTKEGCAEGECGACTVVLDGAAVMSCLVPAAQADGAVVTTVEGLSDNALSVMQQAFVDQFAVQCGFCIPGFVVAAQSLADELGTPPTRDEVEHALSGNLCRCTGYYNIIDAVCAAMEPA